MYRRFLRAFLALIVMTAAPGILSGAFAMSETSAWLGYGEMVLAELTPEGSAYSYIPVSNSVYGICLFPGDDGNMDVRAELWQGDELLDSAENTMQPISRRLTAGEEYVIRLYGSGTVRMEVARHALSRCFDMPMELSGEGDEYSKAIARAGDVHWYAMTAESAMPVVAAASPGDESMQLNADVFADDGRLIARGIPTENGAFLASFVPEPGKRYLIRLSDSGGHTGAYTIITRISDTAVFPESLEAENARIEIKGRTPVRIRVGVFPENASGILLWESSDTSVARVRQNGMVTGVGPGTAYITAYAPGGLSARWEVAVANVPVEGIALLSDSIRMHVGDDASLECEIMPANASDPYFDFAVQPEGIVEFTGSGVIRAVSEGTAEITVTTRDGGYTARAFVTVEPALKRYRALLVGQEKYASTVAAERRGSTHSVNALRYALESLSYDGSLFQVETSLDASRDEVLLAISNTFSGASEQDFSVFYITCHGYYADGSTFLQMSDGSVLTVAELELALRRVPGEVMVMIDCCGSGGAIGRESTPEDILQGITHVFSGNEGGTAFLSSKYRVLASAALEQDSYRISFGESSGESAMATVFARVLCEAIGWNIDTDSRSAMRADVDFDGSVTFTELSNYARRRVMWYLNQAGSGSAHYVQTVQFWPSSGTQPLFGRIDSGG
ncbi:MAG: Ig-like domain-containing protein [Clostridia bacterium]|nr:Ig-like domain-containing protein [Clostridia bacterium]